MEKELLIKYVRQQFSQHQIAKLEDCSQKKVSRYLKLYGLKTVGIPGPKAQKPKPKNTNCAYCGNSLTKEKRKNTYCSSRCFQRQRKEHANKLIKTNSYPSSKTNHRIYRNYIIDIMGHSCAICNKKTWRKFPIPLVLDHIDGNPYNNKVENLRVICPNCDAQQPTYKGKNRGNGRFYRRERYKNGQSY